MKGSTKASRLGTGLNMKRGKEKSSLKKENAWSARIKNDKGLPRKKTSIPALPRVVLPKNCPRGDLQVGSGGIGVQWGRAAGEESRFKQPKAPFERGGRCAQKKDAITLGKQTRSSAILSLPKWGERDEGDSTNGRDARSPHYKRDNRS